MRDRSSRGFLFFIFPVVMLWIVHADALVASRASERPKQVINPDKPLYGTISFEQQKDLTIDDEDLDRKEIYGFGNIAINSKGDIYASDRRSYRINVFDRSGRYRMALGRQGQGPGEFSEIRSIVINEKDELFVDDAGFRLHVFDGNGHFVRTITLDGAQNSGRFSFGVGTSGQILSQAQIYSPSSDVQKPRRVTHSIDLLSQEGRFQKSITTFESEIPGLLKYEGGLSAPNNFCDPNLRFATVRGDTFAFGFSSDYVFVLIDSDGNSKLIIKMERRPSPLTNDEKKKIVEHYRQTSGKRSQFLRRVSEDSFHFPRYKPFFSRILSDDKGRLYVERFRLPLDQGERSRFDVFDAAGRYIYDLMLPSRYFIIHDGRIYSTEIDADSGSVKLVRYAIMNWNQLKS